MQRLDYKHIVKDGRIKRIGKMKRNNLDNKRGSGASEKKHEQGRRLTYTGGKSFRKPTKLMMH